jgi:DMSO/TMAO reductase YedYZ molybdopterin-dependent catalytic subunit
MLKRSTGRTAALGLILACLLPCSARAQQRPTTIAVTGDVKQPLTFTAADLAKLPRAAVTTRSNTITAAWEGVWLSEILKKAGVPLGSALRGKALTTYVVVSASDGYEVLFSLGELDPDMTESQILVADTANGKSLIDEGESFRLVIPKDKAGARSVRLLSKIEVIQVRK